MTYYLPPWHFVALGGLGLFTAWAWFILLRDVSNEMEDGK
jgi:hypothetical protein